MLQRWRTGRCERIGHIWCDGVDRLASAYHAGERTLVLIRPGGYVGLISDAGDSTAITDYLTAVGRAAAQSRQPAKLVVTRCDDLPRGPSA